jgi:hypothetical protein
MYFGKHKGDITMSKYPEHERFKNGGGAKFMFLLACLERSGVADLCGTDEQRTKLTDEQIKYLVCETLCIDIEAFKIEEAAIEKQDLINKNHLVGTILEDGTDMVAQIDNNIAKNINSLGYTANP